MLRPQSQALQPDCKNRTHEAYSSMQESRVSSKKQVLSAIHRPAAVKMRAFNGLSPARGAYEA
jgi:hypothetical protein